MDGDRGDSPIWPMRGPPFIPTHPRYIIGASLLPDLHKLSGLACVTLVGLGSYMAWFHSTSFCLTRLLASARFVGRRLGLQGISAIGGMNDV
jgi:hypothetical protein